VAPHESSDDDATLAAGIASGDEQAFGTLFRKYQGPVYRFARQMGASVETAEDVTQELFITLIDAGGRFDPALGSFRVFLYGITRHLIQRHLRKHSSRREFHLDHVPETTAGAASATPSALSNLERAETLASLRRAIATLPTHYREVLVLCDLHELRYEDAARIVDCPIGTIRSRLSRARRVLAGRCRADVGAQTLNDAACPPRRCLA
jgi:RNA polymerase sigma-70 factor (ECF subfamily)